MACVENISPVNGDSEMEEGEIVDDLSDISSEEEFLLRQRLQVLENYNNVLERKKAKSSSVGSGKKQKKHTLPCDLSEISTSDLEESCLNYKNTKVQRHVKFHHRQKRKKSIDSKLVTFGSNHLGKNKDVNKKKRTKGKKSPGVKIISESSEESEDEYRNKRRKLANAVVVNKDKNDRTSLTARLKKMLCKSEDQEFVKTIYEPDYKQAEIDNITTIEIFSPISSINADDPILGTDTQEKKLTEEVKKDASNVFELIDLSTDGDVEIVESKTDKDTVNLNVTVKDYNKHSEKDSDDDLELLRQHALKTKVVKTKTTANVPNEPENKISEDEDSDTAELRLICLKSALLKKAIEMKQKQKLQKRLSQSSNLQSKQMDNKGTNLSKIDSDNNTDIESVDMDIGSDGDEKLKDCPEGRVKNKNNVEQNHIIESNETNSNSLPNTNVPKEDELEDDEDLLRAKLLTSLSKNLPNLVNNEVIKVIEEVKNVETSATPTNNNISKSMPEEKRFIIKLDESDSEGESEATKNLTKMHIKLSEQIDFQQKLDMFLKSTRMEVENTTLPDLVKQQTVMKKPEKFVAKAVKHLPKSEQIEYKNLVKRMAELEKFKQSRNSTMNLINQPFQVKDTLKPRNITVDATKLVKINNVEKQIAMSRKRIAEESAKMLKLKEEATKLSQKYKIVATELRNIATAITFNKKQQRSVQNCLTKIRLDHQKLLKSSTSIHSNVNGHMPPSNHLNNKIMSIDRLQKENNPSKEEYKNLLMLKTVKVSVVNDLKHEINGNNSRLSVQVDVNSNKKIVKMPKSPVKERTVNLIKDNVDPMETVKTNDSDTYLNSKIEDKGDASHPVVEKGGGNDINMREVVSGQGNIRYKDVNDYKSPLQALDATTWEADPNAILCPFEVGGVCKDAECKYLHTKTSSEQ